MANLYSKTPPLHHPVPQHVAKVLKVQSPSPFSPTPDPAGPSSAQPSGPHHRQPHQQTDGFYYGQQSAQTQTQPSQSAHQFGHHHHPTTTSVGADYYASGAGMGYYAGPHHQQQQQQQQQPSSYGLGGLFSSAHESVQAAALGAGQSYVHQRLGRHVNVSGLKQLFNVADMKHLFDVTNGYVGHKLRILLFPWRNKGWLRKTARRPGQTMGADMAGPVGHLHDPGEVGYAPPALDNNAPDLYIPVMAAISYVLLSALMAGMNGAFRPDLLSSIAGTVGMVMMLETAGLKTGFYVFSISNGVGLFELLAYSGYKFVHMIVLTIINALLNRGRTDQRWGVVGWLAFAYLYMAASFFMLRTTRDVFFPDSNHRFKRTQFLFVHGCVVQMIFMWILA